MAKVRLDTLLFDRGLASSREKARALVLAGEVWADGMVMDKPGSRIDENTDLVIVSRRKKYASRGGLKLEGAIKEFNLDFKGKVVLDVGASTGGYTDCALQHGAVKVYALDVGYGQLDWQLRNDERVKVIERTNIRYFSLADLGEPMDIITVDVSFISTRLIYHVLASLLKDEGEIVCLIKPQFEAGKDKVGKKGVVKEPHIHKEVLRECIKAAETTDLYCNGVCFSPIKGPQGNIEYFTRLSKQLKLKEQNILEKADDIVLKAHRNLEAKT